MSYFGFLQIRDLQSFAEYRKCVVEPFSEDGKKEFKKKANDIYCDIVSPKLRQPNLNIDEKKRILDKLCYVFEN